MINIIYDIKRKDTRDLGKLSGIYLITLNNKKYVGSTYRLNNRLYEHIYCLNKNIHPNRYLQNAYNKYGKETFKTEILEVVTIKNIIEREQFWMDKLNPEYNLSPAAGSNKGCKFSKESRKRMSVAHTGKIISKEHCENISKGRLGIKFSEEHKLNLKNSWNKEFRIKPITATHRYTKEIIIFDSIKECCQTLKVTLPNIHKVLRGLRTHTGGYTFIIHDNKLKDKKD